MWFWIALGAVLWLLLLVAMLRPFRDSARRELQWRRLEREQSQAKQKQPWGRR